jgi:hypothetical protein
MTVAAISAAFMLLIQTRDFALVEKLHSFIWAIRAEEGVLNLRGPGLTTRFLIVCSMAVVCAVLQWWRGWLLGQHISRFHLTFTSFFNTLTELITTSS